MNTFKKTAGLVAVGCSLAASAAQAASTDDNNYFFLDLFAVQHEERVPERDLGFGGRLGLGFPLSQGGMGPTAVEVGIFANPIVHKQDTFNGDQSGLMLDIVQNFKLGFLSPYVFGGLGMVSEDYGRFANGTYFALEAGAGLAFQAFGDTKLRLGVSGMSVYNDELRSDHDEFVDMRFNLGLAVPFGEAAPPPAKPAPAPAPADSDGDGLVDSKDACPSTPASTADGCPPPAPVVKTDADNDGVYDSEDTCPGTLEGLKVDEKGCAVQTVAQSVVLKGVTFLPSSATLTPDAKTVLETAAAALSGDKSLKVELGGHTDSQGKDAANLALSQKRADSVRQYLIGKGIEGSRLTAKGYGETQPIADNNTVEGRKENRRVELKIVK